MASIVDLTPKQQLFVEEYLKDLNATAAYKRAGYRAKGKAAEANASRLLRNAKVAAAVQVGRQAKVERVKIEADDVLRELLLIAKSTMGDVLDFTDEVPRLKPANQIGPDAQRLLSAVKVKRYFEGSGDNAREVEVVSFKLWSKDAALDKLMRHLGLYKDKVDVNVKGPAFKVYLGFDPNEAICPPSSEPDKTK